MSSLWSKKSKRKKGAVLDASESNLSGKFYALEHRELNRVFWSWVKQAWVYLLAGEPGIGKSTLMLQLIDVIQQSNTTLSIAYFSAEEHPSHVKDRRERVIQTSHTTMNIFHTSQVEDIAATTKEQQFDLIIVDSVQTIHAWSVDSPAWSPNQVRQASEVLTGLAKKEQVTTFIIGHVTKWWEIAWPKYLEHIVDVVMYLEWDKDGHLRFLRTKKNRFWPTDDVWIFEMAVNGLQPVYNLQERILQQISTDSPGSVLSIALDSWRPVLVQVEALLNKTSWKYPVRRCIGVDSKRVDMIIAILSKYLKMDVTFTDIFINIPWETTYTDAGLDLAIAAAIYSQYKNATIARTNVFAGEITLSGQIKQTKQHKKRSNEVGDAFTMIDHLWINHIVKLPSYL